MRFRLAPNISTLDDLERPKRPSFRNRKVLREVAASTRKKLNEDRHKLSAGKCRRKILVSSDLRYIKDIREGTLGRASNDCGL